MYEGVVELSAALVQTSALLLVALSAGVIVGGPLGIVLYQREQGRRAALLAWTVQMLCRIPFVVMLVALAALTRGLGGNGAAPLAIVAIASVAQLVAQHLRSVPAGMIDTARAIGGSEWQIVRRVLLVEARAALVRDGAMLATTLLSYAAIAGLADDSGVGALVLRHGAAHVQGAGIQGAARAHGLVMVLATLAALVVQVQLIDLAGRRLGRALDWRKPAR